MLLDIFLTLFLVFLNGFFVAAEFAIVKVRISRIELLVNEGRKPAIMAKHIISRLDAYLSATQLGITLASLGLGWIGESVVSKIILNLFQFLGMSINPELAHNIALPVAFAIITVLHIVFGELAPKSLAIQRSESTTLAIAYPLNIFYYIFKPIIWLLNGFANFLLKTIGISPVSEQEVHSPEELRYLVEQGNESGNMKKLNYDIIKNAFDFSETTARQVMIPRTQLTSLDVEETDKDKIEKLISEGYSRVPVYKGSVDNVIGILYIKDLLIALREKEHPDINSLLKPIHVVPESKKISDLLGDFQKQHIHMSLVINEYGGTEGIVSLEDIIEELVGEIQDEYDREIPLVEEIDPTKYRIVASASINDLNEYLPFNLPEHKEYESLGGLIIFHLGRIPNVNEKIIIENNEFTILKMNKNKIISVQVKILPNPESGGKATD